MEQAFRAVDHLGQVALDVVDQLSPPSGVLDPPLSEDHVGERRVVDLHVVTRTLRQGRGGEEAVGLEKRVAGP
jgi:hypothetical protein